MVSFGGAQAKAKELVKPLSYGFATFCLILIQCFTFCLPEALQVDYIDGDSHTVEDGAPEPTEGLSTPPCR